VMTGYQVPQRPQYVPPPKVDAANKRLNRRNRSRMKLDEIYNCMADIYLECNPNCAMCDIKYATQVHHICRGDAGRAASLLNIDTWLGVCQDCHDELDGMKPVMQMRLKVQAVEKAILRLKT
jgi:hypothetical protein